MDLADIEQVGVIDKESFPTMWPPVAYKRELQQNRLARYIVAYQMDGRTEPGAGNARPSGRRRPSLLGRVTAGLMGLFGEKESREDGPAVQQDLAGLAGLWFMVDEAHLTTIAVRQSARRQGIGELLLISAIELAEERQCRFVTLEVRVSNTGAQALYRKYGFSRTGVRRGYYTDNHEDALIMSTDNISSEAYQALFQGLKQAYLEKHGCLAPAGRGAAAK